MTFIFDGNQFDTADIISVGEVVDGTFFIVSSVGNDLFVAGKDGVTASERRDEFLKLMEDAE